MSKPDLGRIVAQAMTPPAESRDIEAITADILDAQRRGGQAVLDIGLGLIEAKAMLSHGEWLPWLSERVNIPERTAQKLMRLARECSNPSALADLGATKALMLLALPAEEREAFAKGHNVIDMTTRQLEDAIRERNEARVARAFRLLLTCALTYSISLWALCLVRPGVLVAIFLDQPELSAYAQRCLRVFMSGSLFFGAQLACQQTFVALSRAKISVFLALLRKVILLIPLIYILPAALPVNKVLAVILAEPVADLTAVTVTTTTFAIAFRRIRAEMRRRAGQVK